MRKVFVSIYECQPGMQTAETIYNEYGAVIVAENTILDPHLINKLKKLDIVRIKIYDKSPEIISASNTELFNAQYVENAQTIKELLHDISNGGKLEITKVNTLSDSVYSRLNENRDIMGCINRIRGVDEYTYTHSLNVSMLSMLIAKWMKYDRSRIRDIVQAGLLHDVGKSMIPVEILNKPGALDPDEFEEIKKHPVYGYRILERSSRINQDIMKAVLLHHEREDGSGYPMGVRGPQIHEYAKIIAVADIYDAMTSNRAYRAKESPFDAFELMENNTFGVLDPVVVNTFLQNVASYYIGDQVRLNTGDTGEIIYINPRHIAQPIVRVNDTFIDLSIETYVKITGLL